MLFKNCPEKARLLRYNVFFLFQTQRQTRDVNVTFDHLEEPLSSHMRFYENPIENFGLN